MRIKDGQEFLEKLEGLDPALIEEAGRIPQRQEHRHGLGFGTWLAAAACVAALCLPLILRWAFAPPDLPLEEAAGAGEASHQAPAEGGAELAGEEKTKRDAGENNPAAQNARSIENSDDVMIAADGPGIVITSKIDGENAGLTTNQLRQEYIASFEEGMPAEEYFKYNSQTAENRALWDDYLESDFGIEYAYRFWDFPQLKKMVPELEGYRSSYIFPEFEDPDSELPSRLSVQWQSQELDASVGYITVNILDQPEEIPLVEQEGLREYILQNQQTQADRDGVLVTALGGLETEKTLSFWREGRFYRIYGDRPVPPETMVRLLDWLLGPDLDLEAFTKDRCYALATLQDYPDAFAGYYPTDRKWAPKAKKSIVSLEEDTPTGLELDYFANSDGYFITYWMVGTGEFAEQEMNYATLDKYLADLTEEDLLAYLEKQAERRCHAVAFWWNEEVKAVFWYRPGTGREKEIWEFIQYLQSDQVKIERMIGDVVELRPYASAPEE